MATVTFSISFDWLSFRVFLPDLDAWCKANCGDQYTGLSADTSCRANFLSDPGQDVADELASHWVAMDETTETAKWTLFDNRNAAVESAKVAILSEAWDDMIAAERKMVMGQALTDSDKDALLVKYPQGSN